MKISTADDGGSAVGLSSAIGVVQGITGGNVNVNLTIT